MKIYCFGRKFNFRVSHDFQDENLIITVECLGTRGRFSCDSRNKSIGELQRLNRGDSHLHALLTGRTDVVLQTRTYYLQPRPAGFWV